MELGSRRTILAYKEGFYASINGLSISWKKINRIFFTLALEYYMLSFATSALYRVVPAEPTY